MNKTRRNRLNGYLTVLVGILLGLWVLSSTGCSTGGGAQEFIVVRAKGQPGVQAGVLINGNRNGTTGVPITLGSPGWVVISVDLPKAKEQRVNVKHTTPTHPMNVEIDCD